MIGKLSSAIAAWAMLGLIQIGAKAAIPGTIRDSNMIALLLLYGMAFW